MKIPRIIIAGITSGVGKTSITAAIIHGIRKAGHSVQPFKVGPDYIDPSYLSAVATKETRNLDPWLMGEKEVLSSFVRNNTSCFSVIEGVMGFYDGFSGKSNFSSTFHIANLLKTPVLLVMDAGKSARSIAATALGFTKFQKNSRIAGIILNKIGSKKHEEICKDALKALKLPIIGTVPYDLKFNLESRHLGLIPIEEQKVLQLKIKKLARIIAEFLDINKIIRIGLNTSQLSRVSSQRSIKQKTTIAVALDNSFNFYYPDNLNALRRYGAKIKFFSPLSDSKIPLCDGLYLGGGFPEILGGQLARNKVMKKNILKLAEKSIPIYAECGGLMYLTKSIGQDSKKFKMVGLFDVETKMKKMLTLNYTRAQTTNDSIISRKGKTIQGHEFHYSELDCLSKDSKFAYKLSLGRGIKDNKDGLIEYNVLASYMHLHFARSTFAEQLVQKCIRNSRK
ncbi:MAG: Cobyrinate a,c-diamide synthase [Nitrosopumilales archaeon]|nr:MAG: Cobyrinate a,c-diamide synthase [Nitrosopumilales archaeon]